MKLQGLGLEYATVEEAKANLNFLQILLSSKQAELINTESWINSFKALCNSVYAVYRYYGEFALGKTINFETDTFPSFSDLYLAQSGRDALNNYLLHVNLYLNTYKPALILLQSDIPDITQQIADTEYFIMNYVAPVPEIIPEPVPAPPVIEPLPAEQPTPVSVVAVEPVPDPTLPETPEIPPEIVPVASEIPVVPADPVTEEIPAENPIITGIATTAIVPGEMPSAPETPVPVILPASVTPAVPAKRNYLPFIIGISLLSFLYLLKSRRRTV